MGGGPYSYIANFPASSPSSISSKHQRSYPSRTLDSEYMSSNTGRSPVESLSLTHTGKPPNNRNDLLLDLNDEQPIYNDDQRSPINDDDLLRAYTADHDASNPRPSISYDEFVGAAESYPGTKHLPGGPGTVPSYEAGLNAFSNAGRTYSQASELGNYQRYADDLDDYQQKTISNESSASTYPPAPTAPKSDPAAKANRSVTLSEHYFDTDGRQLSPGWVRHELHSGKSYYVDYNNNRKSQWCSPLKERPRSILSIAAMRKTGGAQ